MVIADKLVETICAVHGITPEQLASKCRKRLLVDAKIQFTKYASHTLNMKPVMIAPYIGTDRTTIYNQIRRWDDWNTTVRYFRETWREVVRRMNEQEMN